MLGYQGTSALCTGVSVLRPLAPSLPTWRPYRLGEEMQLANAKIRRFPSNLQVDSDANCAFLPPAVVAGLGKILLKSVLGTIIPSFPLQGSLVEKILLKYLFPNPALSTFPGRAGPSPSPPPGPAVHASTSRGLKFKHFQHCPSDLHIHDFVRRSRPESKWRRRRGRRRGIAEKYCFP